MDLIKSMNNSDPNTPLSYKVARLLMWKSNTDCEHLLWLERRNKTIFGLVEETGFCICWKRTKALAKGLDLTSSGKEI